GGARRARRVLPRARGGGGGGRIGIGGAAVRAPPGIRPPGVEPLGGTGGEVAHLAGAAVGEPGSEKLTEPQRLDRRATDERKAQRPRCLGDVLLRFDHPHWSWQLPIGLPSRHSNATRAAAFVSEWPPERFLSHQQRSIG